MLLAPLPDTQGMVSPKVPPVPPLQELKHKILLKGKKIGRLEDVLDGPGDEAPDVSDDDNGAEAEEERRRMKVGGPGWGPGGAEPLDTAVGHHQEGGGGRFWATPAPFWHHRDGDPLPAPFPRGWGS